MENLPIPFCTGCQKYASEIDEYIEGASDNDMTIDDFVREEEGTYNPFNGHFLCTDCYIKAGMPAAPVGRPGWIAP
jgi:hypothetical protein